VRSFRGALFAVVMGTTLGMMLANVPAVLVGEKLAARLPLKYIRWRRRRRVHRHRRIVTMFGTGRRLSRSA
jgi:UDP:flavonoid glycosyltransferase YjiC (YdhE family)